MSVPYTVRVGERVVLICTSRGPEKSTSNSMLTPVAVHAIRARAGGDPSDWIRADKVDGP